MAVAVVVVEVLVMVIVLAEPVVAPYIRNVVVILRGFERQKDLRFVGASLSLSLGIPFVFELQAS